jgi:hypothetical protein
MLDDGGRVVGLDTVARSHENEGKRSSGKAFVRCNIGRNHLSSVDLRTVQLCELVINSYLYRYVNK